VTLLLVFACKTATDSDAGRTSGNDTALAPERLLQRTCGTLRHEAADSVQMVAVAGSWNDWDVDADEMEQIEDGVFEIALDLEPGVYPYKFVEKTGEHRWICDPDAELVHCDAGYDAGAWDDCSPGANACNSLLVVEDCSEPALSLDRVDIDRDAGAIAVSAHFLASSALAELESATVKLDGAVVGDSLAVELSGLEAGRHVLTLTATDTDGQHTEPVTVPFWLDGRSWETGLMYYVFVDRFENGDPQNDGSEGAEYALADYAGGDWQGVIDRLDYLDELGVTAIWLTAPVDNASGSWGWDCNTSFTGYHGYWPSSSVELEEHFGDAAVLRELIDGAHARNMRVLVDWVGNHVHQDHPYLDEHPDWFAAEPALCDDANNWDDIPETCWFDTFLPDVAYDQPEALYAMVDDAVDFALAWELDGFRVDAVKHMPHSTHASLQGLVRQRIEHRAAGGDEDFYTVGETFDGDRGLIASYISDAELDAQFDFPLYFTLRSVFLTGDSTLADLEASFQDSTSSFDGAVMSTFFGNHDVERSISVAWEGEHGECPSGALYEAPSPDWEDPYDQMAMAWTWLMTHEGLPLVYYGDEFGLPGHYDPDNRQLMRFGDELSSWEQDLLTHVQALGQARRDHPQLAVGERTVWWEADDAWAWTRVHEGEGMLAAVNLGWDDTTLQNGASWAGLPESGTWTDVVNGGTVSWSGDSLSVTVPARGSVLLVP